MPTTLEEQELKELLKQAILELIEEREDLFRELFTEALEDIALINAIKEAEGEPEVSKEEVLAVLEGVA